MNCSPANLASQAACYKSCLSQGSIAAIKNYLLCAIVNVGGIGANPIPTGAAYSGGGSYSLAISPNTTYAITWGANDTSATVGSTSYPSTGASTQTTFYSSGNTTITFFGTKGSTVTAMLRVAPKDVPILTGLAAVLNSAGTQIAVSWDTPPPQITATNVYTSTDQVTWTLAATVNTPGASTALAAPAVGSVLYIRAYWTSGIATNTLNPLTVNQPDTDAANWAARVVTNGGSTVGTATVAAASTFNRTLKSSGLWSLMYHMNIIAADSLTAALTPMIVGGYTDPWTNNAGANLSVTTAGLKTTGQLGQHCSPGNLSSQFTLSSGGITMYVAASSAGLNHDCGNNNTAFTDGSYFYALNSGNTQGAIGSPTTASISVAFPGNGYFSMNRVSTTDLRQYWANSTHAHAQVGSTAAGAVTVLTANEPFPIFGSYNFQTAAEGFSSMETISFMATHAGLTSAQSSTLYNAVQALRTALGGGFV